MVSQRGIRDLQDTALQFRRILIRFSVGLFLAHLPNKVNASEGLVYFRVFLGGGSVGLAARHWREPDVIA